MRPNVGVRLYHRLEELFFVWAGALDGIYSVPTERSRIPVKSNVLDVGKGGYTVCRSFAVIDKNRIKEIVAMTANHAVDIDQAPKVNLLPPLLQSSNPIYSLLRNSFSAKRSPIAATPSFGLELA